MGSTAAWTFEATTSPSSAASVHRPLPSLDAGDLTGRLDVAAVLDPLNGHWPSKLLGCAVAPANRVATTQDFTAQRRTGLHADDFDRLPHAARPRGRRRLCRSLGPARVTSWWATGTFGRSVEPCTPNRNGTTPTPMTCAGTLPPDTG
ncbi:hypothetical protein [Streptomyces sp. NPDC088725]|uniref:hypothetical protein n=1 Tax=Streptomyces sp. NPDC088725 TaxID=3365873 RepID=UPI0038111B03